MKLRGTTTLTPTKHSYYCSDQNYHKSNYLAEYKSWEEFINTHNTSDHDLNHCFRFDLIEEKEGFVLYLFYVLQRKGDFLPVRVSNIQEGDLDDISEYLQSCWDYLKKQWEEFSVHD